MTTARTQTLFATTFLSLVLAACGGGSGGGSSGTSTSTTRGAITARSADAITVNGVRLSISPSTVVRVDDGPGGVGDLQVGMVVTVKGTFDDRLGGAAEIEVEHGVEGHVDAKGLDHVVVGGQRVQVDDATRYGDDHPRGLDDVAIGSVIAVSGVPVAPTGADDRGGLRASRIDLSPRSGGDSADDDDLDVKGFVANLVPGDGFELRLSPDAPSFYAVDASGLGDVPGLSNGAYVEVHTLTAPAAGTPPVIATLVASSIEIEDRFGAGEVEIEGYVTSVSGSGFVVDGVRVRTSASTRYELGAASDLAVGVKVEAEGVLDAQGVLDAEKVSFRPGVRVTATIESFTGTDMMVLGIPVQLPSWVDDRVGGLRAGLRVELRGEPSASGAGIVAHRIVQPTGNDARVFVRAVVEAKGGDPQSPTYTVLGFTVTPAPNATLQHDRDGDGVKETIVDRAAFHAAIEPGHTVLKVRAASAGAVDVGTRSWTADELEIEGND